MAKTIAWKAKRCAACRNQIRERESVPFMVWSYFIHSLSNVVSMQIVKSSSIGCLEQASLNNAIFLYIGEIEVCWKAMLTCYLKNWCKKTRINNFSIFYCEKKEHTPWWNDSYQVHMHHAPS
jgi:hypothetical protein